MNKKSIALISLLITLLLSTVSVYAYTYTLKNEMSSKKGIDIWIWYKIERLFSQPIYAKDLAPGDTYKSYHGGWEAGCCITEIDLRIEKELPGCPGGNLKEKNFKKTGLWCFDKTIRAYRDGCELKFLIE